MIEPSPEAGAALLAEVRAEALEDARTDHEYWITANDLRDIHP